MTDVSFAINLDRFVRRLHMILSQRAKEFDPDRVGAGGAMLLLTLHELGSAPLSLLSDRLVRDKSQITREIASLERKRMVERTPSPHDARSFILTLSTKGNALVERHQAEVANALNELLIELDKDERALFAKLIAKSQSKLSTER